MNPLLTLEWSPPNQHRHKLELGYSDDSWRRQEARDTNDEWHLIGSTRIQTPTITIASPTTNWHTDDPLVAYFPDPDAAVAVHPDGLRYRAARSQHWHPIDDSGLTHLLTQHGPPTFTPLSHTPFEHDDFAGDHPLQTGGETDE